MAKPKVKCEECGFEMVSVTLPDGREIEQADAFTWNTMCVAKEQNDDGGTILLSCKHLRDAGTRILPLKE
ncbi:MAG: hypothetical protein NXI03_00375 [Alphaproteobacteria bacterium]|uniref:hypothetical protein n=1 Tax=Maricaulis alexandrii TaxID=2570354 RepID=UPI001108562A|nr:hypothetical protein [Maricaulis alexandrii]MCR9266005.1 hypothetical protein [Alphaproteobacteria bacterium]